MKDEKERLAPLLPRVKEIVDRQGRRDSKLMAICQLLRDEVAHYDWVGFYFADESKRELNLGPFVGEPTEHTRIPFGEGICGRAAETKETYVSQDVYQESKYLPCSARVRAEMVVPILKDGKIACQLDIDSHALAPFTEEDRAFLEDVGQVLSRLF